MSTMASKIGGLARDALTSEQHRQFWAKLGRVAASVPFTRDLLAAYYCAVDASTPNHVRAVLIGAIAYFILPFDVVPDFIAGLGFADDASVLAAAIASVRHYLTPSHFTQADIRLAELRARSAKT